MPPFLCTPLMTIWRGLAASYRPIRGPFGQRNNRHGMALRTEFEGRDAIVAQLQTAMVKRIDRNGSLRFRVEGGPPALAAQSIAIEGFISMMLEDMDHFVHPLIHGRQAA
ncbi:hypothetical protein [Pararhizobium sp. A13]|uniref:hypothetical protein n=1 Tax=Pararhizobium sp. A13 TaxID=3133975 RepID=UPI00324972AE